MLKQSLFIAAVSFSVLADAAPLTINSGGYLSGSGSITGADIVVNNGGVVDPTGCLSVPTISFSSGSSLDIDISGTTACSSYDQLQVTGSVDLQDATINAVTNSYTIQPLDVFSVVANDAADSISNTFLGLAEDDNFLLDGLVVYVSYTGGDGNDAVLNYKYDDDNDGVTNDVDAFPNDPAESIDTDNDSIGNNADWDDDNDGVPDVVDADPLNDANTNEINLPLNSTYQGGVIKSNYLKN